MNLKKISKLVLVFIAISAVAAFGAAQFTGGIFNVVGDAALYNNDPFSDFNTAIAEDPTILLDGSAGTVVLEGATLDAFEATLTVTDPTADFTVTLGDFVVSWVQGGTAADALDTQFFTADEIYKVKAIRVSWGVAESTGAMDVMLERLQGTEACAAGDDLQTAVVDATATANTVTTPTLTATTANLTLAAGNRLCVDVTATPNEVTNLVVSVLLGQ